MEGTWEHICQCCKNTKIIIQKVCLKVNQKLGIDYFRSMFLFFGKSKADVLEIRIKNINSVSLIYIYFTSVVLKTFRKIIRLLKILQLKVPSNIFFNFDEINKKNKKLKIIYNILKKNLMIMFP